MLPDRILPVFRDEEDVVMTMVEEYFRDEAPRPVFIGNETPDEDLDEKLPFIRVGRTGGAPIRGSEHTDRPVVDIDVLATTRDEAKAIAREIEQLLLAHRHPIDRCSVLMSPQKVPWVEGGPIRRMYASYQLALRR